MGTDGITNVAGMRRPTFTVDGVTYTLSAVGLGSIAEVENYILNLRKTPHEVVAELPDDTPRAVARMYIDAAMREATRAPFVTPEEMTAYDNTVPGVAHRMMLSLRPCHPEIDSVEKSLAIIEAAGNERLAELQAKIEDASGDDKLKNSDGRTETPQSPAESDAASKTGSPNGGPTASPGPNSTEDSPIGTAGPPDKSGS